MLCAVVMLVVQARTRRNPVPHGLVPAALEGEQRSVHDRVIGAVGTGEAVSACARRLRELRRLIANGQYEKMLDLSYALPGYMRGALPDDCSADRPVAEFADMMLYHGTPLHRERGGKGNLSATVQFRNASREIRVLNNEARKKLWSGWSVPVSGVELDGQFVLAEASVRCSATGDRGLECDGGGRTRVPVADLEGALEHMRDVEEARAKDTARGKSSVMWAAPEGALSPQLTTGDDNFGWSSGLRKALVIPVCPQEYADGCVGAFDYGLIQSNHGGNVTEYLEVLTAFGKEFVERSSYGKLELEVTITPPYSVGYAESECGDWTALDSPSKIDPAGSLNDLGLQRAKDDGYGWNHIDTFAMSVIAYCPAMWNSGFGVFSNYGAMLNLYGVNYDNSFVHELGHNWGADHASAMTGGTRGQVAYEDASNSYQDYGSPLSLMGAGLFVDGNAASMADDGYGEFGLASKVIFDWVADKKVVTLSPYEFDNTAAAMCNEGCGPYVIEKIDGHSLSTDATIYAGIELQTQADVTEPSDNHYFYLEYRTVATDQPGIISYWTSVSPGFKNTGRTENTVLTDATPTTTNNNYGDYGFKDAQISRGASYVIYMDSTSAMQYPVAVQVDPGATDDQVLVTLYTAASVPGNCKVIADGSIDNDDDSVCPSNTYSDSNEPDTLVVDADWAVAGTRCCSDSTSTVQSYCTSPCDLVDYATAEAMCAAQGKRLCTANEILNLPLASGSDDCSYDYSFVWTTDARSCTHPTLAPGPSTAPTSGEPTVIPTPAPTGDLCHMIVDGSTATENYKCPNTVYSDKDDPDSITVADPDQAVAGTRCCDDNGNGESFCNTNCEVVDYATALALCETNGWRLCTETELLNHQARATGCWYDSMHVWSSDLGICPPAAAPTPAPTSAPTATPTSWCQVIVDGHPYWDNDNKCTSTRVYDDTAPTSIVVEPTAIVAGTRCCNATHGDSVCDWGCQIVDYATAVANCDSINMRLCSEDEIIDDRMAIGTGCSYDYVRSPTRLTLFLTLLRSCTSGRRPRLFARHDDASTTTPRCLFIR